MLQLDMQHGIKKLEIKGNFKAKANSLNCCYLLIIKLLPSRHLAIYWAQQDQWSCYWWIHDHHRKHLSGYW